MILFSPWLKEGLYISRRNLLNLTNYPYHCFIIAITPEYRLCIYDYCWTKLLISNNKNIEALMNEADLFLTKLNCKFLTEEEFKKFKLLE